MTQPTPQQIAVDPNGVIEGLLHRLSAATLEVVQLRVVLAQQEQELTALRLAQAAAEAPQTNGVPVHNLTRQEN